MQVLHQRPVLRLRVADDDIVVCDEEHVGDLPLGGEGLAASGSTKDEPVGVFQQLSVYHDEVVGKGVQPAVEGFLAVLKQLLGGKRHEDRHAGGGQPPLDLDLVQPQGEAAHEALLLLKVQPRELAVVLLGDGARLKDVVAEALPVVRHVHHKEGQKKHTLVAALQLLQELFRLRAVGGKVGGDNIHIVAGAHRFFLLLNGHFLQVGDLALNGLDGLHLIHGLDVHTDDKGAFHIQEVRQHPVVELRR